MGPEVPAHMGVNHYWPHAPSPARLLPLGLVQNHCALCMWVVQPHWLNSLLLHGSVSGCWCLVLDRSSQQWLPEAGCSETCWEGGAGWGRQLVLRWLHETLAQPGQHGD